MGTVKEHFKSLGFPTVYNECTDFYGLIRDSRIPPHDVLVTNPPYSQDHVQNLLRFCSAHDKPYLLLLPVYVCVQESFLPSLNMFTAEEATKPDRAGSSSGAMQAAAVSAATAEEEQELDAAEAKHRRTAATAVVAEELGLVINGRRRRRKRKRRTRWTEGPVYIYPKNRYSFSTPKGLRGRDDIGGHVSQLGHHTSPYITLWCIDLEPVCTRLDCFRMTKFLVEQSGREDAAIPHVRLCTSLKDVQKLLQRDGATLDDFCKRDEKFRSSADFQWLSADSF